MAFDRIDAKINGLSSPLGTGGWVELSAFEVGYYGISTCTLTQKNIKHEATALAYPNDLIELSRDGFASILWKGRVSKYTPGGVAQEGVTVECVRLEDVLSRRICRWNAKSMYSYNQGLQTDTSSPSYDGNVTITSPSDHRWTLGQILIDVLEHAVGINTTSRLTAGGGYANFPIVSNIPLHHPDPSSVTNPYASVVTPGPARDYLDQLIWDPAEILALLNFRIPDVQFRDMDLWSVIEQIVSEGGEHGVFIDPTQQYTPRLIVHKFSNSTLVTVRAGARGVHAETPSVRLLQDDWVFDDTHVKNLIVIQGADIIGSTNPTLPSTDPLSGKMDQIDATGNVWRVRNQDAFSFLSGNEVTDPRNMQPAIVPPPPAGGGDDKKEIRPLLYIGSTPYTTEDALWIGQGICCVKTPLAGQDVRVKAMFAKPFQVVVGPDAASNSRYPAFGPFDAYDGLKPDGSRFRIVKEMHISAPEFTAIARKQEQEFPGIFSRPPKAGSKMPGGKLAIVPLQRRKTDALGYRKLFLSVSDRDDVAVMRAYAEEYQRRFRDLSVKLTLTLTGILLEDLWQNSGAEIGLRKRVSLIGLDGNKWSDAQLQVMSVRVDVQNNRTIVECSSTIYNMTKGLNPVIWSRRKAKQKQEKHETDLETLLRADQLGDQGGPAPDGEATLRGFRQLSHQSPMPMFERYPGFRSHLVEITAVPTPKFPYVSGGLGVYTGRRVDEFYEKDDAVDTIVKFFHPREDQGGKVLLKVGDRVVVSPVQRDSLSIFLSKEDEGSHVEVEQDEAHVSVPQDKIELVEALVDIPPRTCGRIMPLMNFRPTGCPEYSHDAPIASGYNPTRYNTIRATNRIPAKYLHSKHTTSGASGSYGAPGGYWLLLVTECCVADSSSSSSSLSGSGNCGCCNPDSIVVTFSMNNCGCVPIPCPTGGSFTLNRVFQDCDIQDPLVYKVLYEGSGNVCCDLQVTAEWRCFPPFHWKLTVNGVVWNQSADVDVDCVYAYRVPPVNVCEGITPSVGYAILSLT